MSVEWLAHPSPHAATLMAKAWDDCARLAWGDDANLWPFDNPYRVIPPDVSAAPDATSAGPREAG